MGGKTSKDGIIARGVVSMCECLEEWRAKLEADGIEELPNDDPARCEDWPGCVQEKGTGND